MSPVRTLFSFVISVTIRIKWEHRKRERRNRDRKTQRRQDADADSSGKHSIMTCITLWNLAQLITRPSLKGDGEWERERPDSLLEISCFPGILLQASRHTHTHTHAHTQRNLPPQRLFGEQVILLSDRHSFCVSGIQNHNAHIQLLIICLQLISITMCYPNLDWYLRLLFYSTQAWRMIFQSTFRTRLKLDIACY